ncbi:MAG: O-antigen ligase family protein, partial [Acidobacteria bacterium]|nr:O-antigen ligase family protein [Acidobacteriota bacterium]
IWRDALRIAHDFPLTGTGLNTYERAAAVYRTTSYRHQAAHNDYLEIASDGGLLLVIPALALAVAFVKTVLRRFRENAGNAVAFWQRAGAVVGLLGIACQELFEFSLQIPGVTALFVVLCAIAVHRVARDPVKAQLASAATLLPADAPPGERIRERDGVTNGVGPWPQGRSSGFTFRSDVPLMASSTH